MTLRRTSPKVFETLRRAPSAATGESQAAALKEHDRRVSPE